MTIPTTPKPPPTDVTPRPSAFDEARRLIARLDADGAAPDAPPV